MHVDPGDRCVPVSGAFFYAVASPSEHLPATPDNVIRKNKSAGSD